ncbi:MAG TPA: hypothetical protein VHA12_00375 [Candidatus Nanoarchaeia archaeon]|nr:hypothetical protein [Candidatus Nanoarchaeia archaeon]
MQKRAFSRSIKAISGFQIILLISMTFAFSFLLSGEFKIVSAATAPSNGWAVGMKPGSTIAEAHEVVQGQVIEKGFTFSATREGTQQTLDALRVGLGQLTPSVANMPVSIVRTTGGLTAQTLKAADFSVTTKVGESTLKLAKMDGIATQNGQVVANTYVDQGGNVYKLAADGTTYTQISGAGYAGGDLSLMGFKLTSSQNFFVGNMYTGISHALVAVSVIAMIASLAGANGQQTKALSVSAAAGLLSYRLIVGTIGNGGGVAGNQGVWQQWVSNKAAGFIAAGIALAVFLIMYKNETEKQVTFQCLPWEPQLGGSKCEECNKDPMKPCSEYRCKSLGQACELLNKGSDKAQCAWVSKGDVQSPTIQEWPQALSPTNLQYTPANAIRPGARGVTIVSPDTEDGCLPAYTPLEFGVLTNEPAQCKIDYNRSIGFDEMQYYFGESNFYEYNHTQKMRLPGSDAINANSPLLQNDGTFALSVRCRDANGNLNEDEYTINFCVSQGPDTTPPIVEGTSIESGSPVQFGADSVPMEVYTNEPSTCKWSLQDKDYLEMENTMTCANNAAQVNADLQYTCAGNFTGIANQETQKFFVRCQDQPTAAENERNTMSESYIVSLRGTIELSLLSAGPNSTTISASTSTVPVELFAQTDDGADQGKAVCYFSPSGNAGSYLEFYETGDISHKQTLQLSSGNYTYAIRCIDAGGNNVETSVNFNVAMDNRAPEVTRVYKRGDDALQIVTNEDAQCVYSKTSCNYEIEDGLAMTYPSAEQQRVHLTQWKAKSAFYIKCKDAYGNMPSPNSCSIVVSGSDISAKAIVQ